MAQQSEIGRISPRFPCLMLLDTSFSMDGEPIHALNCGLQTLNVELMKYEWVCDAVDIAIITFGPAILAQDFVPAGEFNPPVLTASGLTPMVEAIELRLNLLEKHIAVYRARQTYYWRPWIFLITDGATDGGSDLAAVA